MTDDAARPPLLIKCPTPEQRIHLTYLNRIKKWKADWIEFFTLANRGVCSACGWPRPEDLIFHAPDFIQPDVSPRTLWQRGCDYSNRIQAWKILMRSETLCTHCHREFHQKYEEANQA
jgi:hypothetical protein